MIKLILRLLAVILIAIILGVLGFLIGASIGGNYAKEFVLFGAKGYEATGQIGFILGVLISLVSGWWLLIKKKSK